MRAVAVMCVRNEEVHVQSALRDLIAEGLEVVLIDHESTDQTEALARPFLGRGLLEIARMPWTGRFSLSEQLDAKRRIIERLDHDWIVHVDADEWLSAPDPWTTLADGLRAADVAGYTCVHFNEFVFLPRAGEDLSGTDYRRLSTHYYFYQPMYPFLMRAWKHGLGLDNRAHAGHLLTGNLAAKRFPIDFPLRHYVALSEERARRKYLGRAFDVEEVRRGWHADRLRVTPENAGFPASERMHELSHWSSRDFDASRPRKTHYWEWAPAAVLAGAGR